MNRKETVQKIFGANAAAYAGSLVHAKGESLERMLALSRPQADWEVLDVATGAGHTAFAFAPHVRRVRATDLTAEMLVLTRQGAAERGLENVLVEYAEAESLPYEDEAFELVTCRIAPHHFAEIGSFLQEAQRVLRPGGELVVVDNVVPEGAPGAYVNAFEKLRDPSHGRCLSRGEWQAACREAGFTLAAEEFIRKRIAFSYWAGRHDAAMQSYLRAMLALAGGEAAGFLEPVEDADGLHFHLLEGVFVGRKGAG